MQTANVKISLQFVFIVDNIDKQIAADKKKQKIVLCLLSKLV